MNIAFFASHGGSNFQAIAEKINSGYINANAKLLISNNSDSFAIKRAKNLGIKAVHISSSQYQNPSDFHSALLELLRANEIDLIVLAGYMKKIPETIIRNYKNRILNIHPALLPKFGGQGMYGMNVHKAVIDAKEKRTGATVHIVNEVYDEGRILNQASMIQSIEVLNKGRVRRAKLYYLRGMSDKKTRQKLGRRN